MHFSGFDQLEDTCRVVRRNLLLKRVRECGSTSQKSPITGISSILSDVLIAVPGESCAKRWVDTGKLIIGTLQYSCESLKNSSQIELNLLNPLSLSIQEELIVDIAPIGKQIGQCIEYMHTYHSQNNETLIYGSDSIDNVLCVYDTSVYELRRCHRRLYSAVKVFSETSP